MTTRIYLLLAAWSALAFPLPAQIKLNFPTDIQTPVFLGYSQENNPVMLVYSTLKGSKKTCEIQACEIRNEAEIVRESPRVRLQFKSLPPDFEMIGTSETEQELSAVFRNGGWYYRVKFDKKTLQSDIDSILLTVSPERFIGAVSDAQSFYILTEKSKDKATRAVSLYQYDHTFTNARTSIYLVDKEAIPLNEKTNYRALSLQNDQLFRVGELYAQPGKIFLSGDQIILMYEGTVEKSIDGKIFKCRQLLLNNADSSWRSQDLFYLPDSLQTKKNLQGAGASFYLGDKLFQWFYNDRFISFAVRSATDYAYLYFRQYPANSKISFAYSPVYYQPEPDNYKVKGESDWVSTLIKSMRDVTPFLLVKQEKDRFVLDVGGFGTYSVSMAGPNGLPGGTYSELTFTGFLTMLPANLEPHPLDKPSPQPERVLQGALRLTKANKDIKFEKRFGSLLWKTKQADCPVINLGERNYLWQYVPKSGVLTLVRIP